MDSIQGVSFVFCPSLVTREQIVDFLSQSSIPNGTGHPFSNGQKFVLVKRATPDGNFRIDHVDITHIPQNNFLSAARTSELGEMVSQMMDAHKRQLGEIVEFTQIMANPGDVFRVPLVNRKTCMFTMTNQATGSWFDKCVYRLKPGGNLEVLTYRNRNIRYWSHTGDIKNGNFAFHGVSPVEVDGRFDNGLITGTPVGYSRIPLIRYVQQQPFWAVVDYDQKLIYVIPLPLEEVTLGTGSTAAHMMVGEVINTRDGGVLTVRVPTVICHVDYVDTDDVSLPMVRSVEAAFADFRSAMADGASGAAITTSAASVASADIPAEVSDIPRCDKSDVSIIVQNGTGITSDSLNYFDGAFISGFDSGYTCEVVSHSKRVILPITSRILKGPACALGTNPDFQVPELGYSTIVIVGTGANSITDVNARTADNDQATWLNAIFIVAADIPDPGDAGSVDCMNDLNVAAVNAMAGPCCTVLVRFIRPGGVFSHRFYRGLKLSSWPKMYFYGDEVPFDQEIFQAVVASHQTFPPNYSVCQQKVDKSAYWQGKMTSVDEILREFLGYDYQMFWALRDSIIELFDQFKVIMNSKEIRDFITKLDRYLQDLIEQEVVPLKEQIKETYSTDPSVYPGGSEARVKMLKKLSADLKGMRKTLGKSIRFVADALSKLTSARGVTKNYQSIKAAARANAIKTSVSDATSMTLIQRFEYLTTICDTFFMISLEEAPFRVGLTDTREDKFLNTLTVWVNGPRIDLASLPIVFRQDDRTRSLDSDTYAILAELAGGVNQTPASGTHNLAIASHNQPPGLYQATIGIPLVFRMVESPDPGSFKWTDVCNEPDMAYWRIWFRQTLADSFERIMDVKAKQLPFFLIHLFLCGMESIASGMMGPPDPSTFEGVEPDDLPTTTQAMRALEAHLFSTAASTQTTVNPVYQLSYSSGKLALPKTDDEWWIYIRYMLVMPFIGRSLSVQNRICQNFRQTIARLVWNKVLDSAVTKMCTDSKKEKKAPHVKSPEWLAYVHLVVDVIFQVARGEVKMTQDLAGRLLALSPPKEILSRGTLMMTSFLHARQYLVGVYKGGDPKTGFLRTVAVALFSFVKHSELVIGNKQKLREQIAYADSAGKLRKIYDRLVVESTSADKTMLDPQFPTKWRSYKVDMENHLQRLQQVLMSDIMPTLELTQLAQLSGEDEDWDGSVELAVPVGPRDIFASIPGSGGVIKILDRLDALTVPGPDGVMPSPLGNIPIYHMISIACRDARAPPDAIVKDPVQVYRQLVQTMLLEYKDYDGAIAAGMIVLMP